MPLARVEMLPARTVDQEHTLVRDVTYEFAGVTGGAHVPSTDVARSYWAPGGQLYSDKRSK